MPGPTSQQGPRQVLFERCVVQITVGDRYRGSGFFVAPGRVLTCAHAVTDSSQLGIAWEGAGGGARLVDYHPDAQ